MFKLSAFFLACCIFLASEAAPVCKKAVREKYHNDFVLCRARSRVKLTHGKLDECEYLEDSVEVCGKLLEQCRRRPNIIRRLKVNSLRVSVRALAVENGFNATVADCPVLERYGVSGAGDENVVEGMCNGKEFKDAYKSFIDCKETSEGQLKTNLASLGATDTRSQKKVDGYVCGHFEHTLHNCFTSVKKCSTSEKNWVETRKAFVLSAQKTNKEQKLGLNLSKCALEVEEEEESSEASEVSGPGSGTSSDSDGLGVSEEEGDSEVLEEMIALQKAETEEEIEEEDKWEEE